MGWNFREYGTLGDPIHKSDLNDLTGDWGCLKRFRFDKDAVADGKPRESETDCSGKMVAGTATHETIARAAGNDKVRKQLLAGKAQVTAERCGKVYAEEFERIVGGREVRWYDDDSAKITAKRALMIEGVLNDLQHHVQSIRFLEAGFIVRIGPYYCSGHVDLIYEPKRQPGTLALADWKTGVQRPSQIELDHSWESGVYSAAMKSGLWIAREHVEQPLDAPHKYEVERKLLETALIDAARAYETDGVVLPHVQILGEFPSDIRYVHLPDYPPYEKAGKKSVERPEELEFFKLSEPGDVKFKAGERRGPAWYQVRRTEHDIPRLEMLLKNIVGTVRMGRFFESVGEKCARCPHKTVCLNSGYGLRGDEKAAAEKALSQINIEDDGLGHVA